MEDYTAAEIFQMYTEQLRLQWQHTSSICAYLIDVNRTKKGKPTDPNKLNPLETDGSTGGESKRIPLNSAIGFYQLAQLDKRRCPEP